MNKLQLPQTFTKEGPFTQSQNALQMLPEELKHLPWKDLLCGLKSRAECKEHVKLGRSVAGASRCNASIGLLEPSACFKLVKRVRNFVCKVLSNSLCNIQ